MNNVKLIVIANQETGKSVAVMLHEPGTGRVLMKCRPGDQSLMKMFDLWRVRLLVGQIRQDLNGVKFTRRVKILPTDPFYGPALADKIVRSPYAVRFTKSLETASVDSLLDSSYVNLVDTCPELIEKLRPFSSF